MPFNAAQLSNIEEILNRIAGESILAQSGRDDGMVPAYSLLGELSEHCAGDPAWSARVTATRAAVEARLDAAQPFDDATLESLRGLVEWLGRAVAGGTPPATTPASPTTETSPVAAAAVIPASAPAAPADVVLQISLEDNRELLTEFYRETMDHLQQIEAALLELDHEPQNPEALNSIFRSFHTIKGNAGFLGLQPMHTLAHEVESLLDLARNGKLQLTSAIITEVLRSRDALQTLANQVGTALESGRLPAEIVPVAHLIDAVKGLAGTPVGAAAVSQPTLPPAPALAPVIPLPIPAPAAPLRPAAEAAAPVRPAGGTPGKSAGGTVRVDTAKLDSLMDVVGELVIVQSQLVESSRLSTGDNTTLQRNVAQLSRITKDLQSTAMALRMIPIKPVFQKMERLARDLARDVGKKVSFETAGEDTELDRTVVEEISDPLVHMVRNALDHGIERPEDRIAAGKPEAGSVRLRAYHQGSNIVVELQDDGRGLDAEKIYRKAIEKGVIPAGAQLSTEEMFALIFAPGFSTAEKVTAVSGRGVGMDVVKRNIEKLRGKVEISSVLGRGAVFKIRLPLTMAIIDGLVVRVGGDRFILPSTSVQMALRPARENISTIEGKAEVLDLRGKFLPIHRLHQRFGITADATNPWDGIVVIVESSGKRSALLVDEMISKQEVVIKNLGAFLQNLPGVADGAILGDGNIALILDPGTLLTAA